MNMQLRTVQQSLACRNIRCQRVEPYRDGRNRYGVWPVGKKHLARHTDDVEEAYIIGLRMN